MQNPGEFLSAYLAIDRQFSVASKKPLPERSSGTALFADISGFTPLSSTLAREMSTQRGPEELNDQINRVFSALIDCVRRFHGSVVVFGGDAITCWFDGNDGSLGTPAPWPCSSPEPCSGKARSKLLPAIQMLQLVPGRTDWRMQIV